MLIIGILAAIALPQYTKTVEKSRTAEALTNLKAISDAANRYYLMNDNYGGLAVGPSGTLDIDTPANNSGRFSYSVMSGSTTILADGTHVIDGTPTTVRVIAERSNPGASSAATLSGKDFFHLEYSLSAGAVASKTCIDGASGQSCKSRVALENSASCNGIIGCDFK